MKILVATDGSKHALNAVKYAAKLVENTRSNDKITLISVHDDTGLRHASQFVGKAEVEEAEISGVYEGELTVRRRLLIRGTGQVKGTVRYGELEIERGGRLSGSVSMIEPAGG